MSTVHMVPVHDLVEHLIPGGIPESAITADAWLSIEAVGSQEHCYAPCPCNPTVEHVPNPNGPDGWMYTHHSLDGRELTE